jgi:hypothetical protein
MELEFASLGIEDIGEAQVDLVAYGVFPQWQSYHVPRILLFRRIEPICAGTKNAKHCSYKKKKRNDTEQDMTYCNNIALTVLSHMSICLNNRTKIK